MAEYENQFTLDGKLRAAPGVTERKVEYMARLIEDVMSGDRRAKGIFEESLTTSDAIFNFAHLTNMTVLGNFPDAPREWKSLSSGNRPVSDFRPTALYQIAPDWADVSAVLGANVIAPRIPEGAIYPYAFFQPEQSAVGEGIFKYGFKTGFTFEAMINDSVGFLASLPQTMLKIALDTEESIFFSKLLAALDNTNDLSAGTTIEGDPVVANSPLTRSALLLAIQQLGQRQINGRQVVLSGGYKLIVPAGTGDAVRYALLPQLQGLTDGSLNFGIAGWDPLAGVTVVESVHVTGAQWILLPNNNSAGRPIIESLSLVGHELPELRVDNSTGNYLGGASVPPFEGNFNNDAVDLRIRQFFNAVVWTKALIIHSTGAGS